MLFRSWGFYDDCPVQPTDQQHFSSLLPSSLRDIWDNDEAVSPSQFNSPFGPSSFHSRPHHYNYATESAPPMQYMDVDCNNYEDMSFTGEIEPEGGPLLLKYYKIQFHQYRTVIFKASESLALNPGDYVLTEADRGFDVGQIVAEIPKPPARELKSAKNIVRKAVDSEISQLPQKKERELKAMELCQRKAKEMGLSMKIIGAVFQFDGKKLIFYYSANCYVDFRSLVRSLFKIYSTRIWMVWHDGASSNPNSQFAFPQTQSILPPAFPPQ